VTAPRQAPFACGDRDKVPQSHIRVFPAGSVSVSPAAIALILVAAVAHASWNLFGKQAAASGAAFFIWLLAACASIGYLPVVAIAAALTQPRLLAANWLFLAGTGVLHSCYFLFLQLGYRLGDLSLAYPIGRGTGALLAALAGICLLGERPGPVSAAGIGAIIAGVVVIGLPGKSASAAGADPQSSSPSPWPAIGFALTTGLFIASYTIWDKYAVASLHTEAVLQGYAGFPVMVLAFTPFVLRDTRRLGQVWRTWRRQVLGAAALAPLAYMLVLVALSFTAVSAVAPAREVSVLIGVLLGRRLLGEGHAVRRVAAALAIVAGIIAVAIG
jgi:drug/metabolite transporter (DMT)-like permease